MWTLGIAELVKGQNFSDRKSWSMFINEAADVALRVKQDYPGSDIALQAIAFEQDAEYVLGWLEYGTPDYTHSPAQTEAVRHISASIRRNA